MAMNYILKVSAATFLVVGCCLCQQLFFHLEKKEKAMKNDVIPISNQTSESQTSCFMDCLNHEQCCYVQIKQLVSNWLCSMFSGAINMEDSRRDPDSNIFSGKCYSDCLSWYKRGYKTDGVYSTLVNKKVTKVFCDMTKEGGGWTVFQRRIDGSVDFQRTWDEYKKGFGNADGEYWIGNDLIHQITKKKKNVLIRIKGTSFKGVTKYIIFKGFWIEDEKNKYKVHTGVFHSGDKTLGINWEYLNGKYFTTKDHDNDSFDYNCAIHFGGGWWHSDCFAINPNNHYSKTEDVEYGKGISWLNWLTFEKSLKHISMSLKW